MESSAPADAVDTAPVTPEPVNPAPTKPIQINIWMNNIAGIFQVDELLRSKLIGSGIEKYVRVDAYIKEGEENRLVKEFEVS